MANIKHIVVNGDGNNFPCPIAATIDQAESTIRLRYGLQFGSLQDDNGALVDRAALISTTVGVLSFVGGRYIPQMQQGIPEVVLQSEGLYYQIIITLLNFAELCLSTLFSCITIFWQT